MEVRGRACIHMRRRGTRTGGGNGTECNRLYLPLVTSSLLPYRHYICTASPLTAEEIKFEIGHWPHRGANKPGPLAVIIFSYIPRWMGQYGVDSTSCLARLSQLHSWADFEIVKPSPTQTWVSLLIFFLSFFLPH